ncbi:MAG TPA: type VII secretion target [Actinoplanes sp.]|jgi:hypothetical protein
MSEQFAVRHAEVVRHAGTVSAIADRVGTVAQAGQSVRPGPEAYGRLCVMVPAMLSALQDALVDGISSAAASLHDTAVRLRATGHDYDATDQRRAQAFDEIRAVR